MLEAWILPLWPDIKWKLCMVFADELERIVETVSFRTATKKYAQAGEEEKNVHGTKKRDAKGILGSGVDSSASGSASS